MNPYDNKMDNPKPAFLSLKLRNAGHPVDVQHKQERSRDLEYFAHRRSIAKRKLLRRAFSALFS